MPVGLERLITMADTEREKKKKPFMEDYVEYHRKKEEAAKKDKEEAAKKEDKKTKTKTKAAPSKKKKKKFTAEDLTERELDINSDRDTKSIAERFGSISDLSDKGRSELLYDMLTEKKPTNSERRRRGLPTLGTGKKSGGKVYSRGFRKPKYNG